MNCGNCGDKTNDRGDGARARSGWCKPCFDAYNALPASLRKPPKPPKPPDLVAAQRARKLAWIKRMHAQHKAAATTRLTTP